MRAKPALLWTVTIAYLVLVFYLSSLPKVPVAGEATAQIPYLDKALHFGEYAVLGVLLPASLAATAINEGVLAFTAGAAWAVSDEMHQSFVPGRAASATDVAADAAGLVSGLLIFRRLRHSGG